MLDILNKFPLPVKDFSNKATLVNHMLFMHGVVAASTPLLEQAIAAAMPGPLQDYYILHLEEERPHLAWLEADLATVGIKPLPIHWHAAMVGGSQAYATERVGPVSLLGYMAAVESRPWSTTQVDILEQLHGKQLLRTIRYHAVNDIDHRADILSLIDKQTEQDYQIIREAATHTAWLLSWGY